MPNIGTIQVHVTAEDNSGNSIVSIAQLAPATEQDIPSEGWRCSWGDILEETDPDCQGFVKMEFEGEVFGLIRYGLYPYPGTPGFLEIENVEANPSSIIYANGSPVVRERLVKPVGSWLIWYATKVALHLVTADQDVLVVLVAKEHAVDFYRNVIKMNYQGATNIAPGEDGYVFTLSREQAECFCSEQEVKYGLP